MRRPDGNRLNTAQAELWPNDHREDAPHFRKLNLKTPFESDLYLRRRERWNSLPNQMWILKMKSQIRELVRRKFSIYRFGNMIRLEYLRANLYGKISVTTYGQKLWSLTSVSPLKHKF